jgi:hypothetical protein
MGLFNWLLGDFTSDPSDDFNKVYKNPRCEKVQEKRHEHKRTHGGNGGGSNAHGGERNAKHGNSCSTN